MQTDSVIWQTHFILKGFGKVFYNLGFSLLFATALYGHILFFDGDFATLEPHWNIEYLLPASYLLFAMPGIAFGLIAWLLGRRPTVNFYLMIAAHLVPYIPVALILILEAIKKYRLR